MRAPPNSPSPAPSGTKPSPSSCWAPGAGRKWTAVRGAATVLTRRLFHVSLGHPFYANTERFHIFSDFSQLLAYCTKMSSPWGGYVYAFRNLWENAVSEMYGLGGVGGHSFAHRAVQGRTHRAQAMVQGSLIIPNPIRCLQGPGLHWGTHPRACDWEHISSVFPNPAACVASLVPTLCSGAWPTGRQL